MDTAVIRQKLHSYIETATDKKVKAIFTMVEDDMAEGYNHWEDAEFVEELERREKAYLDGSAKTYTLEEVFDGKTHNSKS